MSPARDALVVSRMQLSRALRSRTALSLAAVYALMAGGSAYGFTRVLQAVEEQLAQQLRVPVTDTPGAMLEVVQRDPQFLDMMTRLLGDEALLDWALALPFLTVTSFWTALGVLPFIAALVGAEAVAPDVRDRCLRFELVRTGRAEILLGRFGGMALLLAFAWACSVLSVWGVAMLAMTGNPPLAQLTTLLAMGPRLWSWTLPFLGLGVAASQLTTNVNWARVLSLGAVTASWIVYALLRRERADAPAAWIDAALLLLPQTWATELWGPGWGWATAALVLAALGVLAMSAGYPVFARRNL